MAERSTYRPWDKPPQQRAAQDYSSSPLAHGYGPQYPGTRFPDPNPEAAYGSNERDPYPSSTRQSSNPFLATFAVPPSLPRLVDSRVKAPASSLDIREALVTDYEGDGLQSDMALSRAPDLVVDDAGYECDSGDVGGLDDGSFDGDGESFGGDGLKEASPYVESVERVDHSRFCESCGDCGDVAVRLSEFEDKGVRIEGGGLFEWM